MSFLMVNTGRTASRAFHLNFKLQPGVVTSSRYELDLAAKRYFGWRLRAPLDKLIGGYRMSRAPLHGGAVSGLVFHGACNRLLYPYDQPRNVQFLSILRDGLGIDKVFFPVRDPKTLFLSQLNHSLASRVGGMHFDKRRGIKPSWRG